MTFDGLRPQRLVVVVGTGTEIGKTYVTARLLRDLRSRGIDVAARKPAQSFGPEDQFTDAHFLADASGESPNDVCHVIAGIRSPWHRPWLPMHSLVRSSLSRTLRRKSSGRFPLRLSRSLNLPEEFVHHSRRTAIRSASSKFFNLTSCCSWPMLDSGQSIRSS